jgi:hypothetical protein
MPECPRPSHRLYPAKAKYIGGDINVASSYICAD